MRREFGKKVGVFHAKTQLGRYDLDVRLHIESSTFTILVPASPGGTIDLSKSDTYEVFQDTSLDKVKEAAEAALAARDVTDYVDIIEYEVGDTFNKDCVAFEFRVARVSVVKTGRTGQPKLERTIHVDSEGNISLVTGFDGKPYSPCSYKHGMHSSIPYTVDRWRKCCAIVEGITRLRHNLEELFGNDDETGRNLDGMASLAPLALPPSEDGK